MKIRSRSRGFTLIETLVALVVAATAAAVILSLTRGMYQRAEQQRARGHAVTSLTNDAVRLRAIDWRRRAMRVGAESIELATSVGIESSAESIGLVGRNFAVRDGYPLPPAGIAFTPIQEFSLGGQRGQAESLRFLAPGLPPPADASSS